MLHMRCMSLSSKVAAAKRPLGLLVKQQLHGRPTRQICSAQAVYSPQAAPPATTDNYYAGGMLHENTDWHKPVWCML